MALGRVVRALAAALCVAAVAVSTAARAEGELPSDGRDAVPSALLEDGGFLELGLELVRIRTAGGNRPKDDEADTWLDVEIGFGWRRGVAFSEGRTSGFGGFFSAGATLWNDEHRVLDLLVVHEASEILSDFADYDLGDHDFERWEPVIRRKSFYSSGLRLRRYGDSTLAQLSLVIDWKHGNGLLGAAHLGQQWQFGNWNAQAVVGLRHASPRLADFLTGIDDEEASELFPAYRAPALTFGEVELELSRALSRKWVFRLRWRGRRFENGVTDSPLIARDRSTAFETGISYVF